MPKRDKERRRRNATDVDTQTINVTELVQREITIPVPNDNWEPPALVMWDGFLASAQNVYYEPTDWALVYALCEDYSRELEPQPRIVGNDEDGEPIYEMLRVPMAGAKLGAILKAFSALMATEGDRRRLQIEVNRLAAQAEIQDDGIVTNRADLFKMEEGTAS